MLNGYPFDDLVDVRLDFQNGTAYERTSVKDRILVFQKKFSEATQRFEVCRISNENVS